MAQATTRSRFALEQSPQIVHQTIPGAGRGPGVRVAILHGPDGTTRAVIHPTSAMTVAESVIRSAVTALRRAGHEGPITTPALSTTEIDAFIRSGFAITTELSLLRCDLGSDQRLANNSSRMPFPADVKLATLPTWRWAGLTRKEWLHEALRVDRAAFPLHEQFDALSIDEALHATPRTWVRFAYRRDLDRPTGIDIVGYAISGRAGRRSYLQRLAVEPSHGGRGVGALLCRDSMAWAHARRASVLAVNTRTDNHRARRLYERLGFDMVPGGLVVLTLDGQQQTANHSTSS
jgi:ribosomal protein S18 acetylase RimI-like enzyme